MRRGLQKSDSLVEHIVKSACDSRVSFLGRSNAHVCKVPPTQRKTRRCIDPTAPPVQDYIVFTYDDYQSGQANPPYPTPPNHIVSIREERFKLVAGGGGRRPLALATAEVYHARSGTWTATGRMVSRDGGHTATLLLNGQVLVAGGFSNNHGTSAVPELYDPTSHTWTQTGSLSTARSMHTATLLPSGEVLVAGGNDPPTATAELYDPASGTWSQTASLNTARDYHTATRLADGSVLVAGGFGGGITVLASAELFRP